MPVTYFRAPGFDMAHDRPQGFADRRDPVLQAPGTSVNGALFHDSVIHQPCEAVREDVPRHTKLALEFIEPGNAVHRGPNDK